jgi:hypothetical protein
MGYIDPSPDKDSGVCGCQWSESLSSWIVVVGGRWPIFADGHGARVWCWGMTIGVSVNSPSHTNHVSPSFGPPFYVHWEGRQQVGPQSSLDDVEWTGHNCSSHPTESS